MWLHRVLSTATTIWQTQKHCWNLLHAALAISTDASIAVSYTHLDSVRWISQAGVSTRIIGAVSSVKQDTENNVKSTFTLNAGEKVYVVTYVSVSYTHLHMEYPYVGNAISDQAQYRDMYQIRSDGFNIVRLGHYPQANAALDACDELGLLAIEPIPRCV